MADDLLYLSRSQVESLGLGMGEIIELVELALRERGEGRSQMPPKPALHPGKAGRDNFIHAMPAYLPGIPAAGLKWVSGYPENFSRGLPYISGLMILNDPESGLPVSVMDCTWITAMRTAAASAVASRHLSRSDPETLAILGCGVQGRTNLQSLKRIHPDLREVRAFDIRPERTRAYVEEMGKEFPEVSFVGVSHPREAVAGAAIVVTAGPIRRDPEPVIEPGWFGEGTLGIALDYDSYWKPEAMRAADFFITDDKPQLSETRSEGYFAGIPEIHADLAEIVAGRKPGRRTPTQRILCMNLGLAIYDLATAARLLELARDKGIGSRLPL